MFVQVGAEYPYYRALQGFGYSAAELREWIPGPGHQSWWLLQNLSGFGGPVTERLMRERAALGGRIAEQLRGLGMTPVLPGYFGTVPPEFAARNPGAATVAQGDWAGFDRPDWLDPASQVFRRLAASYYAEQRAVFGDSAMYRMSPLHEGGRTGTVDVKSAAGAIQRALHAAHPGALWAVLGWQDDPAAELLAGVDTSKLLILDGLSDRYNRLDRETRWGGAPYAIGTIYNFGGHTTVGANTSVWIDRFGAWRAKPHSALKGIAYLPEATGTNPAAFDLYTDLAWEPGPVDQKKWFVAFAARRYGRPDAEAAAAWEELRKGPYSTSSGLWSESQDSLFTARPDLTTVGGRALEPQVHAVSGGFGAQGPGPPAEGEAGPARVQRLPLRPRGHRPAGTREPFAGAAPEDQGGVRGQGPGCLPETDGPVAGRRAGAGRAGRLRSELPAGQLAGSGPLLGRGRGRAGPVRIRRALDPERVGPARHQRGRLPARLREP
ncbi:hypothetical protein GCM10020254_70170 [Streptomyces goshikiensis]